MTNTQIAYDEETGISAHVDWEYGYILWDSPRDWCGTVTKLCLFHSRYNFPNELDAEPRTPTKEELTDWGVLFMAQVYAYEHGDITISMGKGGNPYSCPWDSGALGFVVITEKDWQEQFPGEPFTEERAAEIAEGEVDDYDAHIQGHYARIWTEQDGEVIDGCGGFLCRDMDDSYPREEAMSQWQWEVKTAKENRKATEDAARGSWSSLLATVQAYAADRKREAVA